MAQGAQTGFERLSAVDIADFLLLDLVRRRAAAIVIAPDRAHHTVRYEQGDCDITRANLDPGLADAVAARLALIAGIDITATAPQVGRLRVRASDSSSRPTELLIALRSTRRGLVAELRRVVDPDETLRVVSFPETTGERPKTRTPGEPEAKYRLQYVLGEGGMGTVYRAEHVLLRKPVAIKVLHAPVASDPGYAAQFLLEARAPCLVRHPGVVDVTDFGHLADGRAFIVMELVEAPTLAELLRHGPLQPRRAVTIARNVASALAAVSTHGVVHRDLKPGNIFVASQDQVKLADFGISSVVRPDASSSMTPLSAVAGTPAYMAPEQSMGERPDARSDLYSLGCVLYEMLTGRPPFRGRSVMLVVERHQSAPPPPLEDTLGPVPNLLEAVIHRALAKRPEERFQNAEEMLTALEKVHGSMTRTGWRRWLPR